MNMNKQPFFIRTQTHMPKGTIYLYRIIFFSQMLYPSLCVYIFTRQIVDEKLLKILLWVFHVR